jgi:hypothetical protein
MAAIEAEFKALMETSADVLNLSVVATLQVWGNSRSGLGRGN